tara:strand:+ start:131 stop:418 length:288 start_codon:yes stop_codon:yes gene_type:complete
MSCGEISKHPEITEGRTGVVNINEFNEKSKIRVRVNVSTSVKGVKTYDGTVELIDVVKSDLTMQDVKTLTTICLVENDRLIAELDKRYPAGGGLE